ncbi:hypothetical protein F5I97DRAFT_1859724 [Phlebopus sp. FC_14]|nr:hypothetical protein F5I97DRAFT_1859724 [Phlebopus sp. FC_14]
MMVSPRLNASGRMYAKLRLVVAVGVAPTTCWSLLGCLGFFNGGMLRTSDSKALVYVPLRDDEGYRSSTREHVRAARPMFIQVGLTDIKI